MHFLCLKFSICLVLVSSQISATVYADNIDYGTSTSAKILTNFWKVPWMDVNSSWADRVAPACGNDLSTLFRSADDGDIWALQMLDASSKIPSGILQGNIYDLGMYDQCIKVTSRTNPANIQGRQCRVSFGMPSKFITNAAAMLHIQKLSPFNPTPNVDLSFGAAVCLPSSCGVDDVANFVDASVRSNPELSKLEVRVVQVQCSDIEAGAFTWATVLVISFFALIVALLMFCTACDFLIKARPDCSSQTLETLAQFSLHTNAIKLLSTEIPQGSLPAVHGLRFVSMFCITCVHRIFFTMSTPFVNLGDIDEFKNSAFGAVGLTLPLFVETFFLLSGFLVTYSFLGDLRSGKKINMIEFYLHRYLRMMPSVAGVILFVIFILPHHGSGPLWENMMELTSGVCQKTWWTNLLFVQNFVNGDGICLPHTWYLAVDMQLFWMSPIILLPLYHRPKLGLAILSTFLVASLILPAITILMKNFAALSANGTKSSIGMWHEFCNFYIVTYQRSLSFFVGILCGYLVVEKKRVLAETQTVFNWILASLFLMFCVSSAFSIQPISAVYNPRWEASYVSIGRLAWSLAMAWIVYASSTGSSGPVARFLSLPVFVPFSRLSFGIYLVSFVLQSTFKATSSIAEYYSTYRMMYSVWGDLAVSTILALILNLCFETPVMILRKILRAEPIKIE